MPGTSWLHTRTEWVTLRRGQGRATLTLYRSARLPWYHERYIMAAVVESDLLLLRTKLTKIQDIKLINPADEIIRIRPADLSAIRIDEFAPWPVGEAIYEGYTLRDVMSSFRPEHQLCNALLQSFRRSPVEGWLPIPRGALGLSFIYNCCNGLGCLELTASTLYFRSGTIMDNEGLFERKIGHSWSIHNLDIKSITAVTGDSEDAIQARVMARRMRSDAWDWIVRNELPF